MSLRSVTNQLTLLVDRIGKQRGGKLGGIIFAALALMGLRIAGHFYPLLDDSIILAGGVITSAAMGILLTRKSALKNEIFLETNMRIDHLYAQKERLIEDYYSLTAALQPSIQNLQERLAEIDREISDEILRPPPRLPPGNQGDPPQIGGPPPPAGA